MNNAIRIPFLKFAVPASLIVFVSANIVNVGNLLFNLIFSRLMGPELFSELAFLLTLKLSLLGILNAVQMFITDDIARTPKTQHDAVIARLQILTKRASIVTIIALPLLAIFLLKLNFVEIFDLTSPQLLLIFLLGMPFYLPLAVWRGVAQGRIDLVRIIASANVEMLVRLFGGLILWQFGFGIEGVIFAFVLSLAAAWQLAKPKTRHIDVTTLPTQKHIDAKKILPWAAMQLSIVLALDGDVFVAKMVMSAENAGYIAALSLVQRIIFFASFALASLLLPQVVNAIENKLPVSKYTAPIFAIVLLSGFGVTLFCWMFDDFTVLVLFGEKFLSMSPYLAFAALSATIATINYFLITYLLAYKAYGFAYLYLALSLLQLVFLQLFYNIAGGTVLFFVTQKLGFQIFAFLVIMIAIGVYKFRHRDRFE